MPTLDDAPETVPRRPEPSRRGANRLDWEPARGRRRDAAADPPEPGQPGGPSHRPGDTPENLTRRYFTEALRGGATLAYYEGPGAKRIAFHDHGARLVTDQTHPALARDLAAIAAHRGWRAVRVTGEDEFRREVWMEARALGLDVKGYRPRERDQQELDRRLEPFKPGARSQHRDGDQRPGSRASGRPAPGARIRPDFDQGVAGRLLEAGEAPYRGRPGEALTPFVRIDRGEGRILDVWGAGLPAALARSGAQAGDTIHVRRDGVDRIGRTVRDPQSDPRAPQRREIVRNRWIIEAERFRNATPAQAARDKDLGGAQSHLRVLDGAIDAAIRDPERRARLHAEARALVARELAEGRRFTLARIREIEPAMARDLAEARARDGAREQTRRR